MKIDIKVLAFIPACILALVLTRVVVTFNVFLFLQPVSLLVWGGSLLSWGVMSVLYVRQSEMSANGALWLLYLVTMGTSTFLGGTSLKQFLYIFIDCTLFLMLMFYYKHNLKVLLLSCNLFFSCAIYINLLLMLLFPNWMFAAEDAFDSFLLGGNYNQMGCRLLCGIVTSLLCTKLNRLWFINAVVVIVTSVVTLTIVGSMTALSGLIIFLLLCLIPSFRLQKTALVTFFIFYFFFQIFVCFNGEGLHNSELANYIIVDLLGKDITFTNRTMMWDLGLREFMKSPLIGYGCVDNDWYVAHMTSFAIGPHNFIIGQLLNGGIVLITILIVILGVTFRHLQNRFDRYACCLCVGLVTLLFMMLMEIYPIFFVLYLLTWMSYYPQLCDTFMSKESKES